MKHELKIGGSVRLTINNAEDDDAAEAQALRLIHRLVEPADGDDLDVEVSREGAKRSFRLKRKAGESFREAAIRVHAERGKQ